MSELRRETHEITSRGQWLALRRNDVTASAIGALFDCHPYLSRDDIAKHLRGGGQGDNPAMRRGRIMEPGVAVALAEDHPDWVLTKANTYHRMPDLRLGATPDYVLDDDGLVQCKTVTPEKFDEWHGKPPLAYTLQTLCELLVTGRKRGVLAVMVTSKSLPVYEFEVPRHPAAEQRIFHAVAEWWRLWDAGGIAAPADPAGLDGMLDDGSSLDLTGDNLLPVLLDEREGLKAEESRIAERLKAIDYVVKNRVGPARLGYLPGWAIAYPTLQRKEYTVAASQYRRLTIKRVEE